MTIDVARWTARTRKRAPKPEGSRLPPLRGFRAGLGPSRRIAAQLAGLRARKVCAVLAGGVGRAAGIFTLILAAGMACDWALNLALPWRALFLAGAAASAAGAVVPPLMALRRRLADDHLALMVEKATPVLRGRLISAVQLPRATWWADGAAPELIHALVLETERILHNMPLDHVIPVGAALKRLFRGALLAALVFGGAPHLGVTADALVKRAFLGNAGVPRKTRITLLTGDMTVVRGAGVTVAARAAGILPRNGRVRIGFDSGRNREFSVSGLADEPARFELGMEKLQEGFRYAFAIGDAVSETRRIQVVTPPVLTGLECGAIFPAYTRMAARALKLDAIEVPAGTRLLVRGKPSRKLATAKVRLEGAGTSLPLQRGAGGMLEAELPPATGQFTGFAFELVDENRIAATDPVVYPVRVVPDDPPSVEILEPAQAEMTVAPKASLAFTMEGRDDYGVAAAAIRYQILTDGKEGEPMALPLKLDPAPARSWRQRQVIELPSLQPAPAPGSTVRFWVEARDANDVSGPGEAASRRVVARVVTEQEKRAELSENLATFLDGIGQLSTEQSEINKDLRGIIQPGAGEPPAPRP